MAYKKAFMYDRFGIPFMDGLVIPSSYKLSKTPIKLDEYYDGYGIKHIINSDVEQVKVSFRTRKMNVNENLHKLIEVYNTPGVKIFLKYYDFSEDEYFEGYFSPVGLRMECDIIRSDIWTREQNFEMEKVADEE